MKKGLRFDFLTIYSIFSFIISIYFLYLTIMNLNNLSSLDGNSLFEGFDGMPKFWVYGGLLFPIIYIIYSVFLLWKREKINFITSILLGITIITLGIILKTVTVGNNFYYLTIIQDNRFSYILMAMGLLLIIYRLYCKFATKKQGS